MAFWHELVQAKTMIPVFVVHWAQRHNPMHQSWVGMLHGSVSYLMHLSCWWFQENTHVITLWLYTADKCLIMTMMWGFHYHFEPYSARIAGLPVVWGMKEIVLRQHEYFLTTRFAYFDVLLLSYITYVSFLMIYRMRKNHHKIICSILLALMMIGYGKEIHGLMHVILAPAFWLCYQEVSPANQPQQQQERRRTREKKKFIMTTNKKEECIVIYRPFLLFS